MVLTNLEDEDDNDLHFLQELKQATILAPQLATDLAAPLTIPSSSKFSQYKSKKMRQKSNTMSSQARYVLSHVPKRLIFTPIDQMCIQ
jgi:hypothetical protein